MRSFDYKKYDDYRWDNEILSFLTQIHEHKGKQELYSKQKPAENKRLIDVAKIQSVESSNRIEGIVTTNSRIGQIVQDKTTPRNRNEKEIAGYRDILNTVHESHDFIPVTGLKKPFQWKGYFCVISLILSNLSLRKPGIGRPSASTFSMMLTPSLAT